MFQELNQPVVFGNFQAGKLRTLLLHDCFPFVEETWVNKKNYLEQISGSKGNRLTVTCSGVHESRLTDFTREMWTPKLR